MNKLFSEILISIFIILFFNFLFIIIKHPLSIGAVLLFQTLFIAVFSGLTLPSFWYSYILILIFLGGILILFIYVASMASNEKFTQTFWAIPIIFILSIALSWISVKETKWTLKSLSMQRIPSYSWIYSTPIVMVSSFLIIYLFIVLVAIVKITKWWGGSIRPLSKI